MKPQSVPSAGDVKVLLGRLSHAQLQRLAAESEVPFTTLWKIRDGTTANPGLETVRKFLVPAQRMAAQGA